MEVDDVDKVTLTKTRPASIWTVPSACGLVGAEGPRLQAPTGAVHGTGLSVAGTSEQFTGACTNAMYAGGFAGSAAFAGVRTTDLPVSPPRGAPV